MSSNNKNNNRSLLLDFMMEEISDKKLSADVIKELAYFKKEKNDEIIIYVGAGTCGLGVNNICRTHPFSKYGNRLGARAAARDKTVKEQ